MFFIVFNIHVNILLARFLYNFFSVIEKDAFVEFFGLGFGACLALEK